MAENLADAHVEAASERSPEEDVVGDEDGPGTGVDPPEALVVGIGILVEPLVLGHLVPGVDHAHLEVLIDWRIGEVKVVAVG